MLDYKITLYRTRQKFLESDNIITQCGEKINSKFCEKLQIKFYIYLEDKIKCKNGEQKIREEKVREISDGTRQTSSDQKH